MIKRKDTLGLIDFIRGKYSIYNKEYILNMLKQMTNSEKEKILSMDFGELWQYVWGNLNTLGEQYKNEEIMSREKFYLLKTGVFSKTEVYNLSDLVNESNQFQTWEDAEWGFPKGRRNSLEKDFDCALREFCEETGYIKSQLILLKNIMPYEEIFTGSNYKSYKHKYYIMHMNYENSLQMKGFQTTEVGDCCWKSFDDCMKCIRGYNLEKKRMLVNINNMIITFQSKTHMFAADSLVI